MEALRKEVEESRAEQATGQMLLAWPSRIFLLLCLMATAKKAGGLIIGLFLQLEIHLRVPLLLVMYWSRSMEVSR